MYYYQKNATLPLGLPRAIGQPTHHPIPAASACEGQGAEERHAEPQTAYPDTGFRIFPNPTTGIVQWTGDTPVSVRVFDQLGRLVAEQAVNNNLLDLSRLHNGVYQIHLLDADQQVLHNARVVLNK